MSGETLCDDSQPQPASCIVFQGSRLASLSQHQNAYIRLILCSETQTKCHFMQKVHKMKLLLTNSSMQLVAGVHATAQIP